MPRLFLIDGSSQMYRAYHAMRGGGLSGPGGKTTHAVYIFVNMLRKLIQDHQPQYIGASFDLPGRTIRDDLVSDYKANRTPMPPDLAEQIPGCTRPARPSACRSSRRSATRPTTSSGR
jgi:DNA polymerase-1